MPGIETYPDGQVSPVPFGPDGIPHRDGVLVTDFVQPIKYIREIGNTTGAGSGGQSVTPTGVVPVGHLIVLFLSSGTASQITSVVDSAGNVYQFGGMAVNTLSSVIYFAHVKTALAAAGTITVTTVSGFISILAVQFSGFAGPPGVDRVATNTAFATAANTGTTAQTNAANELALAAFACGTTGTFIPSTPGWGKLTDVLGSAHLFSQYRIATTVETEKATGAFDSNRTYAALVVTLQAQPSIELAPISAPAPQPFRPGSPWFADALVSAPAPVSGNIFTQPLTATVTSLVTIINQVGKNLSATSPTTASISKQIGKVVSGTSTTTASILRIIGKLFSATSLTTASLAAAKTVVLALTATVTSIATIIKQVGKPFSATSPSSASIAKQVGKQVSATVTSTASQLAQKVILLTLSATATTTASISKVIAITKSATAPTTATITKNVGKLVNATATSTASMLAQKAILLTLSATATTSAAFVRQVQIAVTALPTTIASITKRVGTTLTSTATSTALITKQISTSLLATLASSPTITKQAGKTLLGTSTTAASFGKQILLGVRANVSSTASVLKRVAKNLGASAPIGAVLSAFRIGGGTTFNLALTAGVSTVATIKAALAVIVFPKIVYIEGEPHLQIFRDHYIKL